MDAVQMAGGVAAAYEYKYSDIGLGWREIGAYYKAKHITDICAANNLTPKRVLDCGAGSGGILHHLADWGFCDQLHAIDISDAVLRRFAGARSPASSN